MPTINKPKRKYYGNDKQAYRKRQKIYQDPRWQKMRLIKLMEQPLCYVCQLEGKITLAEHLHHLRTFTNATDENEMKRLAFDSNNIVQLCNHHHWCIHHNWLRGAKSLEDIKQYTIAHLKQQGKDIPNENEEQTEENKDWFF